jgi:2-haloacid dehalogenase
MSRYQWLLFDADGTLFDYERSETIALTRAFAEIGSALDANALAAYQRINAALWQALERGEVTPGIIKVRRFTQWFEAIGVTHSSEAFSARYLECLAECSELLTSAAEVVQALQKKYRMAILTNGLKLVQTGRLARSAIRPHIDQMIISEEIGFSKPSKGFFDVALARLGQPDRRELLMIGDSWSSDIKGAVDYGIDACWYNPACKPRPGDYPLAREINSLLELVEWLG